MINGKSNKIEFFINRKIKHSSNKTVPFIITSYPMLESSGKVVQNKCFCMNERRSYKLWLGTMFRLELLKK